MIKVLFVCLGNICRSPIAEGVFTNLVKQEGLSDYIYIDSAGTHDYNIGKPPDSRAQMIASKHGIDLSKMRARQVNQSELIEFDYILAMDKYNYSVLQYFLCQSGQEDKLYLLLDFVPELNMREIPDPFEEEQENFEQVLDLIEMACKALLNDVRQRFNLNRESV